VEMMKNKHGGRHVKKQSSIKGMLSGVTGFLSITNELMEHNQKKASS
jgi:hypothetical protein